MRNLSIGINKFVGKVSINLLHPAKLITSHKVGHAKSAACVINIIINAPAIVQLSELYM